MLLCCDFCGYVLYMLLLAALSIHIWLYYILIRSKNVLLIVYIECYGSSSLLESI